MNLMALTLLLVGILSVVVFQDVKNRTIHVILPIIIFLLALLINNASNHLTLWGILYNMLFIVVNILGVTGYFLIKHKTFENPIDKYIGLGDIIFFIALTPLFNFREFALFFVFGLLFSLITHLVFSMFKKIKTIPLAGYLSVFLIVNVLVKNVFKIKGL